MHGDQPGNVLKKAAGGEARFSSQGGCVPRLPVENDRKIRKGDKKNMG